uniref:Uncharacterized protein n=1 Tax=Arundo donax TaxID=35708 RepID=A0A0A9B0M9_ARUDO
MHAARTAVTRTTRIILSPRQRPLRSRIS